MTTWTLISCHLSEIRLITSHCSCINDACLAGSGADTFALFIGGASAAICGAGRGDQAKLHCALGFALSQ